MNTHLDCVPCFLRQSLEAARSRSDDARVHERIVREVLRMCADFDFGRSPPAMGQAIHRRLRALIDSADPYRESKEAHDSAVLALLPALERAVRSDPDPLRAAVRLAVAANAIDMGIAARFSETDLRAALLEASGHLVAPEWDRFRDAVATARTILYLADNAGEIAVDRLLVAELGADRVTVAVRGAPVLNDATLEEARAVGLTDLVEVIGNGSDAPGTLLEDCSAEFRERFAAADVVLSKGQGNYESLDTAPRTVFFLFKVKCPVAARQSGLPLGANALLRSAGR